MTPRDTVDTVLHNVTVRASTVMPQPIDGEPLTEYALRCMHRGALIAVSTILAIENSATFAHAQEAERQLATIITTTTERTNE